MAHQGRDGAGAVSAEVTPTATAASPRATKGAGQDAAVPVARSAAGRWPRCGLVRGTSSARGRPPGGPARAWPRPAGLPAPPALAGGGAPGGASGSTAGQGAHRWARRTGWESRCGGRCGLRPLGYHRLGGAPKSAWPQAPTRWRLLEQPLEPSPPRGGSRPEAGPAPLQPFRECHRLGDEPRRRAMCSSPWMAKVHL